MSSETRKKACRSSVSQPRVADWKYSWGVKGRERRMVDVSGTERPRLHLPPRVLWWRDWIGVGLVSWGVTGGVEGVEEGQGVGGGGERTF